MVRTIPIGKPRRIAPELIEIGDDVSAQIVKPNRGITTTHRGIVGKKVYSGKSQYFMTEEGATIFSFEPGKNSGVVVTLFGRAEFVEETLFEVEMDRERIAG
jgi:hypothetical protein